MILAEMKTTLAHSMGCRCGAEGGHQGSFAIAWRHTLPHGSLNNKSNSGRL